MEQLDGATIFWLISEGLFVSYLFKEIIADEGNSMAFNLTGGTLGAVIMGVLSIEMGIGASLVFGLLGALSVLFIVNVFSQHHTEDVFGHTDREIKITENH